MSSKRDWSHPLAARAADLCAEYAGRRDAAPGQLPTEDELRGRISSLEVEAAHLRAEAAHLKADLDLAHESMTIAYLSGSHHAGGHLRQALTTLNEVIQQREAAEADRDDLARRLHEMEVAWRQSQ